MASEIISQYEEVDRVVTGFSSRLGLYIQDMEQNVRNVSSHVSGLARVWEGSAADNFRQKMLGQLSVLSSSLERAGRLKTELDSISADLHEAVEELRQAGA